MDAKLNSRKTVYTHPQCVETFLRLDLRIFMRDRKTNIQAVCNAGLCVRVTRRRKKLDLSVRVTKRRDAGYIRLTICLKRI